jgi:hypothetical protein
MKKNENKSKKNKVVYLPCSCHLCKCDKELEGGGICICCQVGEHTETDIDE